MRNALAAYAKSMNYCKNDEREEFLEAFWIEVAT